MAEKVESLWRQDGGDGCRVSVGSRQAVGRQVDGGRRNVGEVSWWCR